MQIENTLEFGKHVVAEPDFNMDKSVMTGKWPRATEFCCSMPHVFRGKKIQINYFVKKKKKKNCKDDT